MRHSPLSEVLIFTACTVNKCAQCDEDVSKCDACATGYDLADSQTECSESF